VSSTRFTIDLFHPDKAQAVHGGSQVTLCKINLQ